MSMAWVVYNTVTIVSVSVVLSLLLAEQLLIHLPPGRLKALHDR